MTARFRLEHERAPFAHLTNAQYLAYTLGSYPRASHAPASPDSLTGRGTVMAEQQEVQ